MPQELSLNAHGEIPAVWIHFLGAVPFTEKTSWINSGLVLKWSEAKTPNNTSSMSTSHPFQQVTLICFEPTIGFWQKINGLFKSSDWEDILQDPYLLINIAFESWFERIDDSAWNVTDLSRGIEMVCCCLSLIELKVVCGHL